MELKATTSRKTGREKIRTNANARKRVQMRNETSQNFWPERRMTNDQTSLGALID